MRSWMRGTGAIGLSSPFGIMVLSVALIVGLDMLASNRLDAKPVEARKPASDSIESVSVPEFGLCVGGTVKRVKDGDTLIFQPDAIEIDVRLLDCWAPEAKGESRAAGLKSKENLVRLAEGRRGRLWLPVSRKVSELTTLSRALGHVWIDGQAEHVSAQQVRAGFAKRTDPRKSAADYNPPGPTLVSRSCGGACSCGASCACIDCDCNFVALKDPDGVEIVGSLRQ